MILCFSEIIKGLLHLLRHIRYIHTGRDKQLPNLDRVQPQLICNGLQRHPRFIKHNSRIHQLPQDLPVIILRLRFPAAAARLSWFIRSFLTHRSQNQLIHFEGHLAAIYQNMQFLLINTVTQHFIRRMDTLLPMWKRWISLLLIDQLPVQRFYVVKIIFYCLTKYHLFHLPLLMQLQRQSVRVMKKRHLLAGKIIHTDRLTFDSDLRQLFHRLLHALHTESKMTQTTSLRTAHPLRWIWFCKDLQLRVLIHTQIQLPVPALRTIVFSDNGEAKLVYVEILCGFVVGYDDSDVVYF